MKDETSKKPLPANDGNLPVMLSNLKHGDRVMDKMANTQVMVEKVDTEVRREGSSMLVSGLITLPNGLNNSHQLSWVIQVRILS